MKTKQKIKWDEIFFHLIFIIFFTTQIFFVKNINAEVTQIDSTFSFINKLITLKENQIIKINNKNECQTLDIVQNDQTLTQYFYSKNIVNIPGYSGKAIELLIGLNSDGTIENIKLINHSEPILNTVIALQELTNVIASYQGKNIKDDIRLSITKDKNSIDIIANVTVTSTVVHNIIIESCKQIGIQIKLFEKHIIKKNTFTKTFNPHSFNELLKINAIKKLKIKSKEKTGDLYISHLNHESIGKNILGEKQYNNLMKKYKDKNLILILNTNKKYALKGKGKGESFDKFHIEQGMLFITFRGIDCEMITDMPLSDKPNNIEQTDSGIFVIQNQNFDPTNKWSLILRNDERKNPDKIEYEIPKIFIEKQEKEYQKIWIEKKMEIFFHMIIWIIVISIFIFRKKISKNIKILNNIYYIMIIISMFAIGFYYKSQPSITNVGAIINILKNNESIDIFLMNPLITVNWIMIIITTIVWGRALFCGWICPFGNVQELIFNIISKNKKSYLKHETSILLKPLKYLILFILLLSYICFSKNSGYIQEVEPFKTIFILGIFSRYWILGIYVIFILLISTKIYRPFCNYLCPLGSILSIPSSMSIVKIERRNTCNICKICSTDCMSNAINNSGKINNVECFACLECINKFQDKKLCPPIINKK